MQYSISDLEQLSGIQSHTIRMWEQRYHALTPQRSAGNTRYYDDKQLVRLLNIVSINQLGLKISQICSLSDEQIHQLIDQEINQTVADNQQKEFYITQLLNYGIAYDEISFNELLSKCIQKYTLKNTYNTIIYPLLVRLGLMWRKDSICAAQEHFLTHIIKQKISVVTDALPRPKAQAPTWVLFLPEDEEHEIGLLFANFLLKQAGFKVIYLGSRVPLDSLIQVKKANRINQMLFFITRQKLISEAQSYIDQLTALFPSIPIHLAGNPALIAALALPKNLYGISNAKQFENMISNLNDTN